MKTSCKLILIILLLSVCPHRADAQQFLWNVDFTTFFDNREFKAPYQSPQTFFGTRLSPEVGLRVAERHELLGGASWIHEMGSKSNGKVDATIYYRYSDSHFKAALGAFPRRLLVEEYPAAMVYDSLLYYRPNINGALIQYIAPTGYAEAYIDWRSRQSYADREIFTLATNGRFSGPIVGGGWNLTLTHFSCTKNAPEDMSVFDNIVINPYLAVDLSHRTPLDSLSLRAGALISLDRNRGDGIWHHPAGFLGELTAEWWRLGIKEVLYAGGRHLTFFDTYGSTLHMGDPFYRARFYSRTDLYSYFLRGKFVELKASVNFHTAGGRLQTQQQLVLKFQLNREATSRLLPRRK